jgi:hypothetical protein
MKAFYVNNDGGGFAEYVEIEPGTTVSQFFDQKLPERNPQDYLIRVNRLPAAAEQCLQEGDRITMTPVKIEGAQRPAAPLA